MVSGYRRRPIALAPWKRRCDATEQWRCAMSVRLGSLPRGNPVSAFRAAMLIATLAPLAACEWFTDFKRQPSVVTWEALDSAGVRGNPQTSVPITGSAVPGFAV